MVVMRTPLRQALASSNAITSTVMVSRVECAIVVMLVWPLSACDSTVGYRAITEQASLLRRAQPVHHRPVVIYLEQQVI